MKRLRFTIRTLLILAVVAAVGIVIYQRQTKIRNSVLRFESFGGTVDYRQASLNWLHDATGNFFATPIRLNLSHSRVGEGELEGIEHLEDLEELFLDRTRISSDDVEEIAKCSQLKKLSLWGNHRIGNSAITSLLKLPQLEVLDIHETRIAPAHLEELAALPQLRRLVFSAEFHSQNENCLRGETYQRLSKITSLHPVGDCFLLDFDAEQIQRFCSGDTSRIEDLIIRNGELDDMACHAMNQLKIQSLDIQSCDIDDRRLHILDPDRFGRVDLFNRRARPVPDISLQGLTDWIKRKIDSVALHDDYVSFQCSSNHYWSYRLQLKTPPLNAKLLHQWIEMGCESIHLSNDSQLPNDLELLVKQNPRIHLQLHHHLFIWNKINRATKLKGLTVYYNRESMLRFSENLSLRNLSLYGADGLSRGTFEEIAKLKELRWLQIQNRNRLTIHDVEPLQRNVNLEMASIKDITPEAEKFLDELCDANQQANR